MRRLMTGVLIAIVTASVSGAGQTAPAASTNAALRYWMAFAVMQDPPADKDTADLLERVTDGRARWDEASLGKILDDNREALAILQRATSLQSCDWGLEYELGSSTPIAHLAKARTIGRLIVLAGKRLAARGDRTQAVDAWLAAIRFSQHIPQGGSLIGALSAKRVLEPGLRALNGDGVIPALDAAGRKRVEAVVRALPAAGLDWSAAIGYEEVAIDVTVKRLQAASDPRALFARIYGSPAPADFSVPSPADVAAFHAFMTRVEGVFKLPPAQWHDGLADVEKSRSTLHPFFQRFTVMTPAVERGANWMEIGSLRQSILDAVR
jgi:hypothetical protein